jgi:glycine dehydrogenase subunit 2
MLTNPNTLGLFEERVVEIAKILHNDGALLYVDGANLNAIMGVTRPRDFGADVMHFNLHKTFSAPHGGGGPGGGPIGVSEELADYLPVPIVGKDGDRYFLNYKIPHSIGRVKSFYGNVSVMVRSYAFLRMLGAKGVRRVSENAVLNANYLAARLKKTFWLPYDRICMHEFVLSGNWQKKDGVATKDMAKRLLDLGFHPPTVYFPLIVPEAIMCEPTENESKETLDAFAEAMLQIAREVKENPQILLDAPRTMPVRRLDEVKAVKEPYIRWKPEE